MTDAQSGQKNTRLQRRHFIPVNKGAVVSTTGKNDDEEFDPPVEMMVHDYDDERTLDEEALEEPQDPQVEVSTLQREGDMPLEQLLAMYGYGDQGTDNMQSSSSELSNHETTPENDELDRDAAEDEGEEKAQSFELQQLYIDHPEKVMDEGIGPARLLRLSRPQSEEDEDYDYIPDEEWRKTIMVGSDFQAAIPEGLCNTDDALPYENDDKLLWNPSSMTETQVEDFLVKARESLLNNAQGVSAIPTGTHTRDDEQALYLLLQCGYNVEGGSEEAEDECRAADRHYEPLVRRGMHKFRKWPEELWQKLPSDTTEQGADEVSGRAGPVLLLVEEDGAARHICQQGTVGEEKVQPSPGYHRLHGQIPRRAGEWGGFGAP